MNFIDFLGIAIGTHRGLTNTPYSPTPPNTLPSFQSPKNHHANYIECDCVMTSDNQLILHHDPSLNNKPIITQTLSEIRKHTPKLETLDTLLTALTPTRKTPLSNKGLCLELKSYETNPTRNNLFIHSVIDMLRTYSLLNKTLFVSFDADLLQKIHTYHTSCLIGLNTIFNPSHPTHYQLTKKALKHPILSNLTYCCPHIDEIQHPKLPNLPKLVWENANENKIITLLNKLSLKKSFSHWHAHTLIKGYTTNTVNELHNLLSSDPTCLYNETTTK